MAAMGATSYLGAISVAMTDRAGATARLTAHAEVARVSRPLLKSALAIVDDPPGPLPLRGAVRTAYDRLAFELSGLGLTARELNEMPRDHARVARPRDGGNLWLWRHGRWVEVGLDWSARNAVAVWLAYRGTSAGPLFGDVERLGVSAGERAMAEAVERGSAVATSSTQRAST